MREIAEATPTDAELIAALRAELSAAHRLAGIANQRALIAEADRDYARRATAADLARDLEALECQLRDAGLDPGRVRAGAQQTELNLTEGSRS